MKKRFFIDYENVKYHGLNGIVRLTSNDDVYIYYSENQNKMTFGLHRRICESNANFYYRKIYSNKKNALDNELIDELKEIVENEKIKNKAVYFIISDDKGYDKIIKEFKSKNIKIDRLHEIKDANQQKKDELMDKIRERLVKDSQYNLDNNEIAEIADIFLLSKDKPEMNQKLQRMFYNDDVKYIFKRFKDVV